MQKLLFFTGFLLGVNLVAGGPGGPAVQVGRDHGVGENQLKGDLRLLRRGLDTDLAAKVLLNMAINVIFSQELHFHKIVNFSHLS